MVAEQYLNVLQAMVYSKISLSIYRDTEEEIIDNVADHIIEMNMPKFHSYYFNILNNEDYYLTMPRYFQEFRNMWKIGVDDEYCNHLESNKNDILKHIKDNNPAILYYNYFKISDKGESTEKQCAVFFSKLMHTFRAYDYTPIDDNILGVFELNRESFYIAFEVISKTYQLWSVKHTELIDSIINKLTESNELFLFHKDKITGTRLLDMYFYALVNEKTL